MKILTFFDEAKVSDGWRVHVERAFSALPQAEFIHAETIEEIAERMKTEGTAVVVAGFSDGYEGTWTTLFPYFQTGQTPVLITGDLDRDRYRLLFQDQTGLPLEMLDSVQFYSQTESLIRSITERQSHGTAETER